MQITSSSPLKLFSIHCGFYDHELSEGIYEFHVNLFIIADSVTDAKNQIRHNQMFKKKQMHIDGIQEITTVNGHHIQITTGQELNANLTVVKNHLHRDL